MGKRFVSMSAVVWCLWWLVIVNLSQGCDADVEIGPRRALKGEPRGRHRLQLLFPLLMRISTRLATLVPTALMALMGIIVFVVFSKKAFLVSLFALFLTLSDKLKKNEEIYIHKINSYPEYNDEEHVHHHHHHGWPKYTDYHDDYKYTRRTLPALPHIPHPIPLHVNVQPFKPLPSFNFTRSTDVKMNRGPVTFPVLVDDNGDWYFRKN